MSCERIIGEFGGTLASFTRSVRGLVFACELVNSTTKQNHMIAHSFIFVKSSFFNSPLAASVYVSVSYVCMEERECLQGSSFCPNKVSKKLANQYEVVDVKLSVCVTRTCAVI